MRKIFILLTLLTAVLRAQTIDETLQQISALKQEIANNTKLVEQKIADLKRTNPLFAEQDPFESDAGYLGRMSRAMPQINSLRKQYLDDLWQKMAILRGRLFETNDIFISLDPKEYDPNNQKWPIVVQHLDYQKEVITAILEIEKEEAATLWKNWDKVQKIGILAVDIGDRIGLAKLILKDPISGMQFIHEFQPMKSFKHNNIVNSVVFSPNGKFMATGTGTDYTGYTGQARIFNLATGQEVKSFPHGNSVNSVAFSPDGKFMATGSDDDNARIFNLATGQEVKSFPHGSNVSSVAFSPDGKFMAVGSGTDNTGQARIFNLATGQEVKSFRYYSGVNSVAFSPDGKFLATGSGDDDYKHFGLARIFNLETGQQVKSFSHRSIVQSVDFSPDGKFLATGGWDNTARIFNLKTGQEVKSFQHSNWVKSVAFSPDGKYLAVGGSDGAFIYRTLLEVEGKVLAQKEISKPPELISAVSFMEPSGNGFLDALEKGKFTVTVKNAGQGAGKGILIKLSPERTANLNYNNTYIEEVLPGKSVSVAIPVEAYVGIEDKTHTIRFDFEEANGFSPNPVEIQFSTQAYLKPDMFVVDVGIADGNGNGLIESAEVIKLTVRIGNKGKGVARSAYAKFYPGENVFITDSYPKTVKLGDVGYDQSVDIPIEFFINDKTKDEIPLFVDLTEETNLATVNKLRIPIRKSERAREITKIVVEGKKAEYGVLTLTPNLSVDIENGIPQIIAKNRNAVAVVIGNCDYLKAKKVDFALRDAEFVKEYLIKSMGFLEGNICYVKNATYSDFATHFGTREVPLGKLANLVKPGISDVFIYYAGHGAPGLKDHKGYFVPVDCDPQHIEQSGYLTSCTT